MSVDTQYCTLVREVLDKGLLRQTRNGEVLSIFAPTALKFDLQAAFPLLSVRRVSLRLVFEELMWFLRGETDVGILQAKNVHIWDNDAARHGSNDLGPIYGHQWRAYGARDGESGIDQVSAFL